MNGNNKWIVGLLLFCITCGMTLTFIVIQQMDRELKEKEIVEETNEVLTEEVPAVPIETPIEEPLEEEDSKKPIYADEIFQTPDVIGEGISEQDARLLESTARSYFRKFDLESGIHVLSDAVLEVENEGTGTILYDLLSDSSMLTNIGHTHGGSDEGHVGDIEGIYQLLLTMNDPEMSLLGLLSLTIEERIEILPTLNSLNPVFEGEVVILSKKEETGNVFNDISETTDLETLYRIDFVIEGYELYAYITKNKNGQLSVYSISEQEEGLTPYLTIKEWQELIKQTGQSTNADGEGH